jgi:hypothetical protein
MTQSSPSNAPQDPALGQIRDLLLAAEKVVRQGWIPTPAPAQGANDVPYPAESDGLAVTALDRVALIGLTAIVGDRFAILQEVIETLVNAFKYAGTSQLYINERTPDRVVQAERWKAIALRIYALGAVALIYKNAAAIRALVVQQPLEHREGRFWIRDAVTALARGTEFKPKSLIPPAATYLAEHSQFFGYLKEDREHATNVLCQFDVLQCLIATDAANDTRSCYPSFGIYYNERTEPIIANLVRGEWARLAFPAMISDERLAKIIHSLDKETAQLFFDYNGWSYGDWRNPEINAFLKAHSQQLE